MVFGVNGQNYLFVIRLVIMAINFVDGFVMIQRQHMVVWNVMVQM